MIKFCVRSGKFNLKLKSIMDSFRYLFLKHLYLLLFFLGGKAGGDGLKLSDDTKRPLGGKAGGGGFELSEPSSIDKRLSVEADLRE